MTNRNFADTWWLNLIKLSVGSGLESTPERRVLSQQCCRQQNQLVEPQLFGSTDQTSCQFVLDKRCFIFLAVLAQRYIPSLCSKSMMSNGCSDESWQKCLVLSWPWKGTSIEMHFSSLFFEIRASNHILHHIVSTTSKMEMTHHCSDPCLCLPPPFSLLPWQLKHTYQVGELMQYDTNVCFVFMVFVKLSKRDCCWWLMETGPVKDFSFPVTMEASESFQSNRKWQGSR